MAYIWQRWIADEFRAAGLTVVEVEGWKNRGRPASTGAFDPRDGVTDHHTASTSSASNTHPTLALLIQGRPDLPGPLCHWSVAYDGVVYVIAAGRANHAGKVGKAIYGLQGADGNAHFMGDEVETNGTQDLPPAQRHSIAVTNAVYLRHFNRAVTRVHRHQDISSTGKWDIGNISTPTLRSDANAVDLSQKDWFDMADKADLQAVVKAEVAEQVKAAIPKIADAVLDAPVTNKNYTGTESQFTLRRMLTNIELDQDTHGRELRAIRSLLEQAVAQGKSAGA